jgi:L-seryl-tRNA(Ser) seleniumtransferase
MTERDSVYDGLGVPTVVNAVGMKTRISGTLMREEAADAMREAANEFVRISDMQAKASEVIAEATGAEAGYVSSGAAAGLTLCAAACIAGQNLETMSRLPSGEGVANEILIPKSHRNSYDHAIRLSGAEFTEIGNNDRTLGPVATDLEPWEIEAAISEETAAVAYVARDDLPLEPIVDVAHAHDVPVMVDAAGRLPPRENLTKFVEKGADLVVFSGGKGIRGPQSTGVVAGRSDLISSIALQHLDMDAVIETWDPPKQLVDVETLPGVPRHGIGRGFKVGKEELVGLVTALELFLEEDEAANYERWHDLALRIGDGLSEADVLSVSYAEAEKGDAITTVVVAVDEDAAGRTTAELVTALRREDPRIFVGDHDVDRGVFRVNPMNLAPEEAEYLVERIRANATAPA